MKICIFLCICIGHRYGLGNILELFKGTVTYVRHDTADVSRVCKIQVLDIARYLEAVFFTAQSKVELISGLY